MNSSFSVKNLLIKAALRFSPKCGMDKTPARILVVATTAMGDTLWATPAIESLRKSFPDCHLAALTSSIGMQILGNNPNLDQLFLLKEPLLPRLWPLRKALVAEKFDTVLLFHASQRLTLPLCASIGASTIVGTAGINKGLDSLLTHPLPNLYQHEIARRLQMVQTIGGQIHSETLSFFLEEKQLKKKDLWVALHPGSKDSFKRWPETNFGELGAMLQKNLGCNILITGGAGEEKLMQKTASLIPGAILERNLPLRCFAARLKQIDLLVCNDTGPFHLAAAVKTPVIGIFAATDPFLCGPYKASNAIAIAKKNSCTPCLKRKCRSPFCLLQIGTCEVYDAAIKMLQ
ncbi:MAG TPA: glycosyltransferase family 9 protein [Chlamydiales bacterium]|nr:glycosyltransferase family 9 protein [Chlamydiales bacterium]